MKENSMRDTKNGSQRKSFFRNVNGFFFVGLLIAVLSDIPSTTGFYYLFSKLILMSMLITTIFFPIEKSLTFLLMVTVASKDIVQTSSESDLNGQVTVSSLWSGDLGFVHPGWLMFAFLIVLFFKSQRVFLDINTKRLLTWILSVPFVTGLLYGGFSTPVALTEVSVDIKTSLFIVLGILIYRAALAKNPNYLSELLFALFGSVAGRHVVDFIYWLIGFGSLESGINRVSVDSTKGTIVLLILISVFLMVSRISMIWGFMFASIGSILIVVYATRMLWLTLLIGVAIMLSLLNMKNKIILFFVFSVSISTAYYFLGSIGGENLILAQQRLNGSFFQSAPLNLLMSVDPYRTTEIINTLATNWQRNALLWGSGYGSYYTEIVLRFPKLLVNAFPEYSLMTGQYYFCHEFIFQVLFKYGIIGLFLFLSVWIVPGYRCYKALQGRNPNLLGGMLISAVAFIPTSILAMSWSAKGCLMSGILIAVYITSYQSKNQTPAKKKIKNINGT